MSGWDGDALAGQMEDAEERAQQVAEERQRRRDFDPAKQIREQKREGLRLSHSRIAQQLERAQNPAHRAMLERALTSLEQEMSEIENESA
jgi:hypothetical protein